MQILFVCVVRFRFLAHSSVDHLLLLLLLLFSAPLEFFTSVLTDVKNSKVFH